MCHLREQLGDRWDSELEAMTVEKAKRFSVERFHFICRAARYAADPDAAEKESQEDFERRWLEVDPILDGMYSVDGVLDSVTGAALKSALDSLAEWRGPEDHRSTRQRHADALAEMLNHVLDKGTLPRRNGVRPHVTLTMSLETLKGELGAPAAQLQNGMPIARSTMRRLACDGSLSRVLIANSVPVDVGRATRSVSPAQWRALKARYKSCAFPDCDRPISWTNPHHIHFWAGGGPSDIDNLIPLCHFHHRLVHEECWIVIATEGGILFIPPREIATPWPRGPGIDWAA